MFRILLVYFAYSAADSNELGNVLREFSTFRLFFPVLICTIYLPDFPPDYMQIFYTEKYALRLSS